MTPTTIRELRFYSARSTLSRPIADATHTIPSIEFIVCDVELANGTIPNGQGAESFDWIDSIIDTPIVIENGMAQPRLGAGWGFRFRESALSAL